MDQIFGGGILWTLLVGLAAGLFARALKPGKHRISLPWTILLGISGALLARAAAGALGWHALGEATGLVAAVIGAVILLVLYDLARRKT